MSTAAAIAYNLQARRQGDNWRCLCPCGCGYMMSLAHGQDSRLLAYCHGGCSFESILAALVDYGLLDDADSELSYEPPVRERTLEDRKRLIDGACWLYGQSQTAPQVDIYLRARGITLSSPVLRFCSSAPHRLGTRLPAMLAPVVDVTGQQIGTHLTYLRADGSAKADLPKEFQRESRGEVRGGAIRLAAHDPERELIVGEGIESTLSAMQLFGLPGWAALSAANLGCLELPEGINRIVIAADRDNPGLRAADRARQRWIAEGRRVRVVAPRDVNTDFNDLLLRGALGV